MCSSELKGGGERRERPRGEERRGKGGLEGKKKKRGTTGTGEGGVGDYSGGLR